MSTAQDGFTDNWSYLRTELGWLDQVLLAAVARQRKQTKEIDKIAQNRADRVTSHWWKGIVSLEGHPSYDEHRKPTTPATAKASFHQQLELKIQSSQKQGVMLGLPLLRDRLGLTLFEKNVILIGLAPEINRRYARLYRYLKGEDTPDSDLPSVDLVLRLLCRNDQEWSAARKSFAADGALVRQGVLDLYACVPDTRLKSTLRLADPCVDFLLSTSPSPDALEGILTPVCSSYLLPAPIAVPAGISCIKSTTTWDDLIVPAEVRTTLQLMCQRVQAQATVDQDWGFETFPGVAGRQGIVFRLEGASGTGKTLAARAIAHTLEQPLMVLDLPLINPSDSQPVLDYLDDQQPPILLVKSAERWFGRKSDVALATLHQWLAQRQQCPCITVLSTSKPEAVSQYWKAAVPSSVSLPLPVERDRLQLWQRAFPDAVPMADALPWRWLAKSFRISGAEIQAIARDTALYAAAQQELVSTSHLIQALTQRGHRISSPPPKTRRSRRKTSP